MGSNSSELYRAYINKALKEIGEDPLRIGSKGRDDLLEGCRFYRVQHHYIAYRIKGDRVEVGRVLHENMNFEKHLSEDVF